MNSIDSYERHFGQFAKAKVHGSKNTKVREQRAREKAKRAPLKRLRTQMAVAPNYDREHEEEFEQYIMIAEYQKHSREHTLQNIQQWEWHERQQVLQATYRIRFDDCMHQLQGGGVRWTDRCEKRYVLDLNKNTWYQTMNEVLSAEQDVQKYSRTPCGILV